MDSPDPQHDSIEEIAKLYDRHAEHTGKAQRVANRITWALGRPASLLVIFALTLGWMLGNVVARHFGSIALEEFPFPDLAFVATIAAFLVALLILVTQRHEEARAENRAQLTLHIAMLSERKIAKVIELLEEQRADNPLLPDKQDSEADEMAKPADQESTMDLIDEVTEERRQLGEV